MILRLLPLLLLLTACAPKPPETFLRSYFTALLLDADRPAALALVQYAAGIAPPEGVHWCFAAEEPFVTAVQAIMEKEGALDRGARTRLWRTLQRDKLISMKRQHTTRTTATTRVRLEAGLFTRAGVERDAIELDYIMLRMDDQTWRVNRVQQTGWTRGSEYKLPTRK